MGDWTVRCLFEVGHLSICQRSKWKVIFTVTHNKVVCLRFKRIKRFQTSFLLPPSYSTELNMQIWLCMVWGWVLKSMWNHGGLNFFRSRICVVLQYDEQLFFTLLKEGSLLNGMNVSHSVADTDPLSSCTPLLKLAVSEPCPELGVAFIPLRGQFNRVCGCSCFSLVPKLTHTCQIVLFLWPEPLLLTGSIAADWQHRTLCGVLFRPPRDLDWQTSPWEVKLVLSGLLKETKAQKPSGNKFVSKNKEDIFTCITTKHWNYFLKTMLSSYSHHS